MAEQSPLLVPIASGVVTNCYPLMRREAYLFQDGTRLERDVPYWQPADERIIDAEGTHYADEEACRRLCFMNSLVIMSDE